MIRYSKAAILAGSPITHLCLFSGPTNHLSQFCKLSSFRLFFSAPENWTASKLTLDRHKRTSCTKKGKIITRTGEKE